MTDAASPSNLSTIVEIREAYPYPSDVIVSDFVTTKLGGKVTYYQWETQISRLLKSHQMFGFINGELPSPAGNVNGKEEDIDAWNRSDSLVKSWIFGSLSEEASIKVENHLTHIQKKTDFTAKDIWDELHRSYGPSALTWNPSLKEKVGEVYPYPSHVGGPNFVTMKLSGKDTYNVWETQILSLLLSHQMYGFIDGQFPCPVGIVKGKVEEMQAWIMSDSVVKGWILGSLSEGVAKKVVSRLKHKQKNTDFTTKDLWDGQIQPIHMKTYFTAKDLLDELQRSYGPLDREQEAEIKAESVIDVVSVSEEAKSKDEPKEEKTEDENIRERIKKELSKKLLHKSILRGDKLWVIKYLEDAGLEPWDKLTNNGNTTLHVAVGSYSTKNHELLEMLLEMTKPEEHTLLDLKNSDGSTLLHVAAIGGNTEAVNILVKRNPELLLAKDNEGHTPLALSVSNMHTNTSKCLFEYMKEKEYNASFSGNSGEELVVLAISCQDFRLAEMIIKEYPGAIVTGSEAVLTALAQNFPRELNFWERRRGDFLEEVEDRIEPYYDTVERIAEYFNRTFWSRLLVMLLKISIIGFYVIVTAFCRFLKAIAHPFIKDTFQVYQAADSLLYRVCRNIFDKPNYIYHHYYNNSIFEATKQNSSTFIRCVMDFFPDAIWSTNEDGHNFIQYSVINRSEKIYNLLCEMSEHKNIYKTIKDSSGNNLLHLAARLSPNNKLKLITGPALQLQRELQWYKEVERFVCPLNRLQKNSDDETPQMVFTREHKDLVIEGENWMKKTAESYTITAALIITIVFAAAITVPGGNNQESGIPVFTNNIAFIVFAISDAISLFAAVTSLLLFLSFLTTARFAEQDFLFRFTKKVIIGLTMLFLSTTAMVIAFGATLFLVFGQNNLLMLIPIGVLTCLPITSFVTLQFPLIVELMSATYGQNIFVRENYHRGYIYQIIF